MTQGEAVYKAVSQVFEGVNGAVPETRGWSEEQKRTVYAMVLSMFKDGTTSHKGNPSDEELVKYIPGLVNDRVRKDKRLNGGTQYKAKNPGSRAGSGDKSLSSARELLKLTEDEAARAEIEAYITRRMSELKPKQDFSAVPPELRKFIPS